MSLPPDSDGVSLAATLILMREGRSGPPELLMLERAATMAFAAGALVFPGGRVEAGDFELAERLSGSTEQEQLAQQIAAIRETIEEVGVAIALDPMPDPATLEMLRSGLLAGSSFSDLLAEAGIKLDPGTLTPFARWRPPRKIARRFDTRFFIAKAPEEAIESADGLESVRTLWASARALLDDAEAGHHNIIFPTWCTLHRLAQFNSFAEAHADGLLYGHHLAGGQIRSQDGEDWLHVDEGIGYPVTARPFRDNERG